MKPTSLDFDLILKNVSKHILLTPGEENYFTSILKPKEIRRKQYVVQAGEICRYENFVVSGCLRAYYMDESGAEHVVQFAIEDWWISDLASLITQTPATLNVDALEDTEILQIQKSDIDELYLKVPKFERFFRILMQNAFVAQQRRIVSVISETAEERYKNFLSKYPAIEQRIPQTQLASYLGITPEFLSKIRSKIIRSKSNS